MYYYVCPACGYRTGCGVTGITPTGKNVTDEEAINIAARKWEQDETIEAQRRRIYNQMKGAKHGNEKKRL